VRDVENRNPVGFVPGQQVFQYGAAQGGIEAGERLIEQQDAWARDERAGERDSLLFAAGQITRPAKKQIFDAKGGRNVRGAILLLRLGEARKSVTDILLDEKMREERQRLKNVSEFAALWGKRNIAGSVKINSFTEADFARVGLLQAGDAIEERGFSGAGRAEQNGEAGRKRCADIKRKRPRAAGAKLFANLNVQHSKTYFTDHGDQTRRFTP
jgi:hypothetical protein